MEVPPRWWSGTRRLLYSPCEDGLLHLCFAVQRRDREGSETPLNFETVKLSSWHRGRVAVTGDAAHSTPPGLGQGCGMAIVNGLSLASLVLERGVSEEPLQPTFVG